MKSKKTINTKNIYETFIFLMKKYVFGAPSMKIVLPPIICCFILGSYLEIFSQDMLSKVQESNKETTHTNSNFILPYAISGLTSYIINLIGLHILSQYVEIIAREYILDMYKEHVSLCFQDFTKIGVGEIVSLIDRKSTSLTGFFETFFRDLSTSIFIIFINIMKITSNFSITKKLLVLIFILFYTSVVMIINYYRYFIRLRLNDEVDKYRGRVYNNILNHDIIKSYNNEEKEAQILYDSMEKNTYYTKIYWSLLNLPNFLGESFSTSIIFLVLFLESESTSRSNEVKVSLFVLLFNTLRVSFVKLSQSLSSIFFNLTNIGQKAKYSTSLDNNSIGVYKNDFKINFIVKNVNLSLNDKLILNNINLMIEKGQKIAITGENGSGKSSLLRLFLGLFEYKGSIKIDGMEISGINKKSLRKLIAYAPQDTLVFDESVLENISNGNQEITTRGIFQYCQEFQTHEIFSNLNNGYETTAGERGRRLSGGQKQRVNFMRAIVKDSPIIALDQVTSALDKEATSKLINSVIDNLPDKTVLMVINNMEYLDRFDMIVYINNGTIIGYENLKNLLLKNQEFLAFYNQRSQA